MSKEKKYLLLGIPILFINGFLFHFLYELTNENILIGIIAPINESIFEHTKLILYPIILYYLIYYFFNKNSLDKNNWFLSMLVTTMLTITCIPMIYYFYTGALGIESIVFDIFILLISLLISFNIGIHIYEYNTKKIDSTVSIFIIISFY